MSGVFQKQDKEINSRRRANKKRRDIEKRTYQHEVNMVFNKFYKNQVASLYREVFRGRD